MQKRGRTLHPPSPGQEEGLREVKLEEDRTLKALTQETLPSP